MHDELTKAQYSPDRTKAMDAAFAAGGYVPKRLAGAEGLITDSGFFGSKICPGDCTYAASLDILLKLEPEILAAYPKSKALYEKVLGTGDVKKSNRDVRVPILQTEERCIQIDRRRARPWQPKNLNSNSERHGPDTAQLY